MRMVLAASVAVATWAGAASAATYQYEYVGQPIECEATDECAAFGIPVGFEPGFTGSLSVDEALLPGGNLAGTTIGLTKEVGSVGGFDFTVSVSSADFSFSETYATGVPRSAAPLPEYLEFSGSASDLLFNPTVGTNSYYWSFDENFEIVEFGGGDMCGGSCDGFSTVSGDGYDDGRESIGPGEWTKVSQVPLPASAVLLLSGLSGLGLARRRGR